MTGAELRRELDALVENTDLWHVLHQLALVCDHRKRATGGDESAAWRAAAEVIETCAGRKAIARAADWQRD